MVPKIILRVVLLLIIAFSNFWIWKIFNDNFFIGIILILQTLLLYFYLVKGFSSKSISIFLLCSFALFYLQWSTTNIQPLNYLSHDERRVQQERLGFYKSVGNASSHYVRITFYKLNLKEYLEGDFNIVVHKLQRNFFETTDPNIYFFGGHPRERVWADDFEKFSFILLVPFLIGIYQVAIKRKWFLFAYLFFVIVLFSLIGHQNSLGPFLLFPPFCLLIYKGLISFKKYA